MPELAGLGAAERARAAERYAMLRLHIEAGISLTAAAAARSVPLRTAQRWLKRYRAEGLAGLGRNGRTDRGSRRSLSEPCRRVVEGLALQQPPLTVSAIQREVARWARSAGERVPSHDTVGRIVAAIAPALLTMGREGEKAYRDAFDLVARREATAANERWQADHTQLDLVAKRDRDGDGRPWLTIITDEYSRAIAGFALAFEAPSALRTALALRQAIWRKSEPDWAICGIPQVLYSDNGSDFTSDHLRQVCADLKVRIVHSTPGVPRGRGKVERFFRTVNQRLLCHLPGYLKRGRKRAGQLLTLPELDAKVREFLGEYHREAHSETGEPPLARWRGSGFLPQMPESAEKLDLLLLTVARSRVVRNDGVRFANHRYVDPVLSAYVGEVVIIRYDPRDIAEIRLFHRGRFLCRAIAPGLAGQTVPLKAIVAARNQQRRAVRDELRSRRAIAEQLIDLRQGRTEPRADEITPKPRPMVSTIKRYRTDRP